MIFKKKAGKDSITVHTDNYELLGMISVQTGPPDRKEPTDSLPIVLRDFALVSLDYDKVTREDYKYIRNFAYQMNMRFRTKLASEWTKVEFETQNPDLVEMENPLKLKALLRLW